MEEEKIPIDTVTKEDYDLIVAEKEALIVERNKLENDVREEINIQLAIREEANITHDMAHIKLEKEMAIREILRKILKEKDMDKELYNIINLIIKNILDQDFQISIELINIKNDILNMI